MWMKGLLLDRQDSSTRMDDIMIYPMMKCTLMMGTTQMVWSYGSDNMDPIQTNFFRKCIWPLDHGILELR